MRLRRSAWALGIPLTPRIFHLVLQAVTELPARPHRGRFVLQPGGNVSLTFEPCDARWIVSASSRTEDLIAVPAPRDYPGRFAGHKTTARAGLERAFGIARRAGAADALLIRRFLGQPVVMETTRANIFWIRDGVVFTPSLMTGCLSGVVRAWVIERLRAWRVPVRTGCYALEVLRDADAIFRTNALIGVRPVRTIRDVRPEKFKNSKSDPILMRLRRAWRDVFLRPA